MFWNNIKEQEKKFSEYEEKLKEYSVKIIELEDKLRNKPDKMDKDSYERIADLEVKMAKIWAILIEVNTLTGKEKITKIGKKIFGGRSI